MHVRSEIYRSLSSNNFSTCTKFTTSTSLICPSIRMYVRLEEAQSSSYVHTYVRQEEGQQCSPEKGGGDRGVLTKAERAARVHNKAERAARFHLLILFSNTTLAQPSAQRESEIYLGRSPNISNWYTVVPARSPAPYFEPKRLSRGRLWMA